jgi:6-phospho-beta-glucosidase
VPSYYLRYFYAHDRVLAEQLGEKPRAAQVMEIERALLEMYRDPKLTEKPALLEQRGGAFYSEAAVGPRALARDRRRPRPRGGPPQRGDTPGLADDDVVEVPARVGRDSIEPLPQAPLAPELLGLASTSPPTSGSPRRPRPRGTSSSRARRCWRTR